MLKVFSGETLVLASGSPRRQEMLRECGLTFRTQVSHCDETVLPGESPQAMVQRLALAKAQVVAHELPQAWILGADTTVTIDGEILGKPTDEREAVAMLSKLQGRTHVVWSAFAVVNVEKKISHRQALETQVTMVPIQAHEIERYVATKEPLDKAGAYAIQGVGAGLIAELSGSYTNVVGLPLAEVIKVLIQHQVIAWE
jgi:septum formation protein